MAGNSNGTRSLAGQRALVTGASSDLGAEIAQALAAAGAAVAINSVCRPEEAERVVSKDHGGGGRSHRRGGGCESRGRGQGAVSARVRGVRKHRRPGQ
jgi:NAD(P)-dependent dehydrogenase (short-subunit alcohol dehydrogenase family)